MASGSRTSARPTLIARSFMRLWFFAWRLVERVFYRRRAYTTHVPFGNRVFTPWFDAYGDQSTFGEAYRLAAAGGPMAVTPDRCYLLHQFARHAARLPGEMAEAGVFTGGTAHLLAETLVRAGAEAQLHLFDSFEGMPTSADPDRDYHAPGDFGDTSEEAVRARLAAYDLVRFHVGFVPGTFEEVSSETSFSFVHVDMDIYPSILDCCRWFWPRLQPGGVMVFDDYGFYHLRDAARAAVDDFFADRLEKPIALPTGQAFVIRG